MEALYPIHWALSALASVLRLGAGAARPPETEPAEPLILYEFEGCPFCRIAREAVSETGVTVIVRPCPKGGARFRPEVKTKGGKAQFPYLIDPNTGVSMYESADIASYLRKTYGGGRARPLVHWLGPFNQILSQFGVLARFFAGTVTLKSTQNAKPLEFQGAERDPGARLVKERLCSLELDYVWRPGAGPARLSDPNAGVTIQGGAAVRGHLRKSYAH